MSNNNEVKETKEFMGSSQIKMGNKYDYFLLFLFI